MLGGGFGVKKNRRLVRPPLLEVGWNAFEVVRRVGMLGRVFLRLRPLGKISADDVSRLASSTVKLFFSPIPGQFLHGHGS